MFPSSNYNYNYNYSGIDPISYNDQQAPNRQFLNDIITTTNPKQDDFPLSFLYLPSPLLPLYEFEIDDHGLVLQQDHDLFLHHQPLSAANTGISETILNMVDSNKQDVMINELTKVSSKKLKSTNQQIQIRRRSSKTDRHSKINTAQGPRDRRMRLSLKVAKEFFAVQDKLGFDKASKTVEWLLIQAKPEIEKLFSNLPQKTNWSCRSASSTSECEVVSGIDEVAIKDIKIYEDKPSPFGKKDSKTTRSSRKTTIQHSTRESRDKARARAREKTLEKMWSRKLDEPKLYQKETNNELSQLGSWIASEAGKGTDTQSHNMNHPSNLEVLSELNVPFSHRQGRIGITEDLTDNSMASMGKWSPSSIFNHTQSTGVSQELQFTDFQAFYKPW